MTERVLYLGWFALHRTVSTVVLLMFLLTGNILYAHETDSSHVSVGSGGTAWPLVGRSLALGVFSSQERELELQISFAENSERLRKISFQNYGFRYKSFVLKQFYWSAGVSQRLVRGEYADETLAFIAARNTESFGFDLACGQVWQNGSFRFAIDWLGYFFPVMSTATQSSYRYSANGKSFSLSGETAYLRAVRESVDEGWRHSRWERLANGGHWSLLRLQFGYVF